MLIVPGVKSEERRSILLSDSAWLDSASEISKNGEEMIWMEELRGIGKIRTWLNRDKMEIERLNQEIIEVR
jgi:hypothetical protein